jgi:hypothetical protein
VRIIVANAPGGPSDIIARIVAAALQETLGGAVFVENRGGAGGNIGMGLAARAEPDGYTLLLSTSAYSVNPGLYEKLPYDPFKDFVPVCELAISPHVFAIKPDLGPAYGVWRRRRRTGEVQRLNPADRTTPQQLTEVLKQRKACRRWRRLVRGRRRRAPCAAQRHRAASPDAFAGASHIESGTIVGASPVPNAGGPRLDSHHAGSGLPDFVFDTYGAGGVGQHARDRARSGRRRWRCAGRRCLQSSSSPASTAAKSGKSTWNASQSGDVPRHHGRRASKLQ